MVENHDNYIAPFIRDLMPGASEEELIEATDNITRLVELCIEIQKEHYEKTQGKFESPKGSAK